MDQHTDAEGGVSEQYFRASPWPVFVALGLTLSEVGVVFNSLSVAVGGILLLSASVVGIFRESGYAATLWAPTAVLGASFGAVGAALLAGTSFGFRGTYIAGSGALLVAAALAFYLHESGRV